MTTKKLSMTKENIVIKRPEFTLYALGCDLKYNDGAIYVGTCRKGDFQRRLKQHKGEIDGGAKFTSAYMHGDIEVLYSENHELEDLSDQLNIESNLTFCLMKYFGYTNVRGGSYSRVVLINDPTLKKEHIDRWSDDPVEDIIDEIFNKIHDKYPECKLIDNYFSLRN
jgi:predicted GIY-YIG superfamily endonuclease